MSCFVGALINENMYKKQCSRCEREDYGITISYLNGELFICDSCIIQMYGMVHKRLNKGKEYPQI